MLELIKEQGGEIALPVPDAYAVIPEASALPTALRVLQALRASGVSVQMHAGATAEGMGSMKSQFKKADASGAHFALVFGADELSAGCVALKPLRGDKTDTAQAQTLLRLDDVAAWVGKLQA